jgi:hypothetical protein
MSGAVQNGTPFPPVGPTTVQGIIPSYLYAQYQDDYWLPYFVTAYNIMSQEWLDWINLINLPVWPSLAGQLLDWIGAGVYGYPRPQLSITNNIYSGGYNSAPYNTIAYNDQLLISASILIAVTDDVYRRCLTWHLYVGDGFQFSTKWLKKRVHRFINGTNGYLADNDTTEDVSVVWSGATATISLVTQPISMIFQSAVIDGVLRLPFQYDFTVTLT